MLSKESLTSIPYPLAGMGGSLDSQEGFGRAFDAGQTGLLTGIFIAGLKGSGRGIDFVEVYCGVYY